MIRAREGCHTSRRGREVHGRHLPCRPRRGDAEETPHVDVAHAVPTDSGIVPVGHDQRAIRGHADITRAKPAVCLSVGNSFDLRGIAGAGGSDHIASHHVGPRITVNQGAVKPLWQQTALIDADPSRRTAAGLQEVGHHAGVVEVPVLQRHLCLQIRSRTPPASTGPFIDIAVVPKLEHGVDPHPPVAIVVIVTLPE